MSYSVTSQIENLCDVFLGGGYSITEFQSELERLFFSYQVVSREAEEKMSDFINGLEVVIFSMPHDQQRPHANEIARSVKEFLLKEGL